MFTGPAQWRLRWRWILTFGLGREAESALPGASDFEVRQEGGGGFGDRVDGVVEGSGVVGCGTLEAGDLADVLEGGGPDLLVGDLLGERWAERSDVSAHTTIMRLKGACRLASMCLKCGGPDSALSDRAVFSARGVVCWKQHSALRKGFGGDAVWSEAVPRRGGSTAWGSWFGCERHGHVNCGRTRAGSAGIRAPADSADRSIVLSGDAGSGPDRTKRCTNPRSAGCCPGTTGRASANTCSPVTHWHTRQARWPSVRAAEQWS